MSLYTRRNSTSELARLPSRKRAKRKKKLEDAAKANGSAAANGNGNADGDGTGNSAGAVGGTEVIDVDEDEVYEADPMVNSGRGEEKSYE